MTSSPFNPNFRFGFPSHFEDFVKRLNSDLLDLVERDLVVRAVVELGGAGALVGVFKRAAIVEIGGDARRGPRQS